MKFSLLNLSFLKFLNTATLCVVVCNFYPALSLIVNRCCNNDCYSIIFHSRSHLSWELFQHIWLLVVMKTWLLGVPCHEDLLHYIISQGGGPVLLTRIAWCLILQVRGLTNIWSSSSREWGLTKRTGGPHGSTWGSDTRVEVWAGSGEYHGQGCPHKSREGANFRRERGWHGTWL